MVGAQLFGRGNNFLQRLAQQGLAAGKAHLADAQLADAYADQPDGFLIAQGLLCGHPLQTFGRHAIGATQVAAIREGDAQVTGLASIAIQQCARAISGRCR